MTKNERAAGRMLLLVAIIAKRARWEPFAGDPIRGEVCVNGLRYSTTLDADGCPEVTQIIRHALEGATR